MAEVSYGLGMDDPTPRELAVPGTLRDEVLDLDRAAGLLASWGHLRPRRWLLAAIETGRLPERDIPAVDLWREVLRDECDKLYNQAWCAYDQIRSAEDEESVWMLAMDDLPSAVEQAFSLAPPLAGEHLALLGEYKEASLAQLLRELGVGTEREAAERSECLAFWEENTEGLSDLRRTLFRMVREELATAC
jgi:hypothetical protein